VNVALEVRPGLLGLGIAASVVLGVVGVAERQFDIDLVSYGVVIVVPLVQCEVGLSPQSKQRNDGQ